MPGTQAFVWRVKAVTAAGCSGSADEDKSEASMRRCQCMRVCVSVIYGEDGVSQDDAGRAGIIVTYQGWACGQSRIT